MKIYSAKTKGGIFLNHNVFFDYSFAQEAFAKTGIKNLMDYHQLDLFTVAWGRKDQFKNLRKFRLRDLCQYFHIVEEPMPHRAINGAWKAHEVLRKLLGK